MEVVFRLPKRDIVAYAVARYNSSETIPSQHCDIVEIQNLQFSHYKKKENVFITSLFYWII